MSLILGTDAYQAIEALRGNPSFDRLVTAVFDVAQKKIISSLSSPIEQRIEATAYARALLDLWTAVEAGRIGVNVQAVKPARMRKDASDV